MNYNNNYYNNNNFNFYDNNISNLNDNSYYSYNNDSNISFKKKNFKTKHYNKENAYETVNKLESESTDLRDPSPKKVLNIDIEDTNTGPNHNIKKITQPVNAEDGQESLEKRREEQCVLEYLKYVNEKYPHLVKINENNKQISKVCQSQGNPRFFIIKSFTEEDIHKVLF